MQSGAASVDSPFRKKPNGPSKRSPKLAKKIFFKIQVWGFPRLPFELYSFSKAFNKDAYLHGYKTYIDSDGDTNVTDIPILDNNGFNAYYPRRISTHQNEVLKGDDSWVRYMIVRNIPGLYGSTEQTRQEGLQALRSYFMDPNHSKFPPESIALVDETNEQNIQSMDNFLLNDDILTIMRDVIEEPFLNHAFYTKLNHLARLFFAGTPPMEAIGNYGYPARHMVPMDYHAGPVQPIPNVPVPFVHPAVAAPVMPVPVVPVPPANAAWAPNVNLASQASEPQDSSNSGERNAKKAKKTSRAKTVFGVSEDKIKGELKIEDEDVDVDHETEDVHLKTDGQAKDKEGSDGRISKKDTKESDKDDEKDPESGEDDEKDTKDDESDEENPEKRALFDDEAEVDLQDSSEEEEEEEEVPIRKSKRKAKSIF